MSTSFTDLGASAEVVDVLARQGITDPTPIQAETIPVALAGRDVCGRAPTGSGKTLAFGVPLAQLVIPARPGRPTALVLVPTRELAAQVERELRPLLALRQRTVATFYGGVGFGAQLKALRRGVDVAVACPGRLADLIDRGDIALGDVAAVVVDEADRMADMGFLPEVRRLLDRVRSDRQTLLFSATLDGDVDVLVRQYQDDPHRSEVEAAEAELDLTTHRFVEVAKEQRSDLTADLIGEHGPTVVFCRTRHGSDRLAKRLAKSGVAAVAIHGGRSQGQRDRALARFKSGDVTALIATDVAARGIHVDDVACVIHFDLPADGKDYVHRSGRTGRAGATGAVVALVTPDDRAAARRLQRDLGMGGGDEPRQSAPRRNRSAGDRSKAGRPDQGTGRPGQRRRNRRRNRRPSGQRTS